MKITILGIFNKNLKFWAFFMFTGQLAFTCSKLTIETVEHDVKYAQRYANGVVLISFLFTLDIFHTLF